jgi:hypothetical protein
MVGATRFAKEFSMRPSEPADSAWLNHQNYAYVSEVSNENFE